MFDFVCFIQSLAEKFLTRSTFVLGRGFPCEVLEYHPVLCIKKIFLFPRDSLKRKCEKNDEIGEGLKGKSSRDPSLVSS